ncbi:MAG: TRAP transporter large permease subunit [Devosia sp.]|nr:TRAP transporter large permease subunit [Devosia sp.]
MHFGMVMIVNMMIGLIRPPIGVALLIASNIAKAPVMQVALECVPYIIGFLVLAAGLLDLAGWDALFSRQSSYMTGSTLFSTGGVLAGIT